MALKPIYSATYGLHRPDLRRGIKQLHESVLLYVSRNPVYIVGSVFAGAKDFHFTIEKMENNERDTMWQVDLIVEKEGATWRVDIGNETPRTKNDMRKFLRDLGFPA